MNLRSFLSATYVRVIITPLLLVAATILTYYPSLTYDFQFDDVANIKKFFALRTHSFAHFAFKGSRWISYWLNTLNYAWGKFDPFYYRLGTMIFHVLTGALVFYVVYKALSLLKTRSFFTDYRYPLAVLTSVLFLLHPVQTQTVSYVIQGQLEGLANLFMMIIAALFLHFATTQNRWVQGILGIIILGLAFISTGTKEIVIIAPVMLLLLDWFFIAQGDYKQIAKRAPFYLAYAAIVCFQYSNILPKNYLKTQLVGSLAIPNNVGNVITIDPLGKITRWSYFISQFKVILHYIWIFFWPFNMSVDYDWVMVASIAEPSCFISLFILCLMGLGTVCLLYKNKIDPVAFGILWFFVGLSPRSTFIPSTELIVDYKTYFSSLGILFLFAAGLIFLFLKLQKKWAYFKKTTEAAVSSVIIVGLLLGFATRQRNTVWRSSEEFWFSIMQNAPLKARGYNNYAVSIAEKERYAEAIPYLRQAIKLDAHYPDPWSNIAVCFNKLNKIDLAINHLEQAIKINPHYPEFYNNLASFYLAKKEYERAKILAEHAVLLRNHYGKAYYNWARALYEEGKKEQAFPLFKRACMNADYDTTDGFLGYAECSIELGKFEDAIVGYTALYQLDPNHPDHYFNLGNSYFCNKDYEKAKKVYTDLVQKNDQEHRAWFNLGETYIELGDKQQGLICFERARPLGIKIPQIGQRIAQFTTDMIQASERKA